MYTVKNHTCERNDGTVKPKFSVCIDMMYADAPFDQRPSLAKLDGADAVEFWKWSNKDINLLADNLRELSLDACLMNLDSADEGLSYDMSRGVLSHRRTEDLIRAIHETAPVMRRLGMKNAIVLAGDKDDEISGGEVLENIEYTLRKGVKAAEDEGITLLLEPLNTFDRPTYVLPYSAPALEIVSSVGSPNLKLLFDIYHTARMESSETEYLTKKITENIRLIGHFHVANSPLRCEPPNGEIDYPTVFDAIAATDYDGYIGFEYRPSEKGRDFSLGKWLAKYKNERN